MLEIVRVVPLVFIVVLLVLVAAGTVWVPVVVFALVLVELGFFLDVDSFDGTHLLFRISNLK